jgi:hypothetical protein
MMRALKATGLVLFVIAAVCGVVVIAAWPLRATPAPTAAASGGSQPTMPAMPAPVEGAPDSSPVAAPVHSGQPAAAPASTTPATASGSTTAEPRSSPPPQRDTTERNTTTGAAVQHAAGLGIEQSVFVLARSSGAVLAEADPDRPMASMSLVKLFIAVDLLDRAGGADHLDSDTLETLWRMITVSDDHAASRLWIAGGDAAIVTRIVERFDLTGVQPPANPGMWGDTTVTARDVAQFLRHALADPLAGPWLVKAMQSAADVGADGFDQNFGMNAVSGTGSKQGWGCCLRGVRSLDSAGFSASRIVVVLAAASTGTDYQTMREALTATVRAAVQA